jgi:hypothetical protein
MEQRLRYVREQVVAAKEARAALAASMVSRSDWIAAVQDARVISETALRDCVRRIVRRTAKHPHPGGAWRAIATEEIRATLGRLARRSRA